MGMDNLEPEIANFLGFIRKGYSIREIFFKGISLKIFSKALSHIKYNFYFRGKGVDIDFRSVIDGSRYISLGDKVWLQRGAWLSVPLIDMACVEKRPYLIVERGTRIGPNCTISAGNKIHIGKNVLFGPNVTVLDHMHQYEDVSMPVLRQGILNKGEVIIEDNSWVAANAVIYSATKRLIIGRNSVIAANSVVRDNVESFTVVSGNPAIPIKKFNPKTNKWEVCCKS